MKKLDILYGVILGVMTSVLGMYLFVTFKTSYEFTTAIQTLKSEGQLGKLITLGTVLNLVVFFMLLKLNRELMARGIIIATVLLAIFTLFV